MKHYLLPLLPPLVLGLLLSIIGLIPDNPELQESAVSPALPLDHELPNWYGIKTQESSVERKSLAADTRFSKAIYRHINPVTGRQEGATINVSIVYSGNDMNSSIHRPERCLPAQGHLNLIGSNTDVELADGRKMPFRRLSSHTPAATAPGQKLHHIHYYVFVGYDSVHTSHLRRTLQDMYDRFVHGRTQRWAYMQLGTSWGEETGLSEQQAENYLRALIRVLVPQQIDWQQIKN